MRVCDRCRQFNAAAERAWWSPPRREEGLPSFNDLRWKDLCEPCLTELKRRVQDVMDRG